MLGFFFPGWHGRPISRAFPSFDPKAGMGTEESGDPWVPVECPYSIDTLSRVG
jgi:hypothetical protein